MNALTISAYAITMFGFKECPKELNQGVGVNVIESKNICIASYTQNYEENFYKTITGKVKMIRTPKDCSIQLICQGPRQ